MAFNINIEDSRYETAINTLEGYVGQLEDIISKYEALNGKVENCYSSDQTKELKRAINAHIGNIRESIVTTNLNITQFRQIKQNAETTNAAIGASLSEAASAAASLFGGN